MMPNLSAHPDNDLAAPVDQGMARANICGTTEEFALRSGALEGIAIDPLDFGARILVRTRYSQYRLTVLDGPSGDVFIEGGNLLQGSTPARLTGATAGGTAVKLGWIGVGLRMELNVAGVRITTSPVRSVEIEDETPAHAFTGRAQ